MKLLLSLLLICQATYGQLTTVGSWNAYVYNPGKVAPVIFAFNGNGEAFDNGGASALLKNGLPKLLSTGWKPLKEVFIICVQSASGSFPAKDIPAVLKAVKAKYPLADTSQLYLTGYSAGGATVMEGVIYKPKKALPLSASGGGATLVNFIADNKIPIIHWVGSLEADNIGWTLYQVNQKVPSLTTTIKRTGVAHEKWIEVYQSNEFWAAINAVPPATPLTVNAGKDQTVQMPASASLSGTATGEGVAVKWAISAGVFTLGNPQSLSTTLSVMSAGKYTAILTATDKSGKSVSDTAVITFTAPEPPKPKIVYECYINGMTFQCLDNGIVKRDKGRWSGTSAALAWFPCGEGRVYVYNNSKWLFIKN